MTYVLPVLFLPLLNFLVAPFLDSGYSSMTTVCLIYRLFATVIYIFDSAYVQLQVPELCKDILTYMSVVGSLLTPLLYRLLF